MPKQYNPLDWYWVSQDGRLYSSVIQDVVAADNEAFVAWSEDGTQATPWPRDEAGDQTEAALQAVLDPYGLFAGLSSYAAAKRFAVETGGIIINGAQIATDRVSQAMIGNAYAYVQASGAESVSYKTDAGFVTLTAEQIKAVALAVGAHVQASFAAEAQIDAELSATPPTITSRAQIDSLMASVSS